MIEQGSPHKKKSDIVIGMTATTVKIKEFLRDSLLWSLLKHQAVQPGAPRVGDFD